LERKAVCGTPNSPEGTLGELHAGTDAHETLLCDLKMSNVSQCLRLRLLKTCLPEVASALHTQTHTRLQGCMNLQMRGEVGGSAIKVIMGNVTHVHKAHGSGEIDNSSPRHPKEPHTSRVSQLNPQLPLGILIGDPCSRTDRIAVADSKRCHRSQACSLRLHNSAGATHGRRRGWRWLIGKTCLACGNAVLLAGGQCQHHRHVGSHTFGQKSSELGVCL